MADDAVTESEPVAAQAGYVCPWCSAELPAPDAAICPACRARLIEEREVDIPGVTTVHPGMLASAASPHKVKRTFGALFIGEENDIPPPTEADLPALARPDLDVRREMLKLELDARLTALQREVRAIEAEEHPPEDIGSSDAGARPDG